MNSSSKIRILKKVFLFFFLGLFFFLCRSSADQAYPQIDIAGFKKFENKKVDVDSSRNYFAALSHLGGFYPTFTGGPWQERLQLRLLGQLSQNLSVSYDLEQQPETPEKYDVKVKYDNNELTFGDINASFAGNEFVSASKTLNGVMLTAKDSWYDIVAVPSGKLKSQTQALTSQKGNNTSGPYNLGHGSIVEGSEIIQLNNLYLVRNVDYTIDYFEGKITFNRLLSQTDEFKYSFEYTNILDLFFPSLSKRDFFGFQSRFSIDPEKFGKPEPKKGAVIGAERENFPSQGTPEAEIQEEESSGKYRLKNFPVEKFSESLTFMGVKLKKNEDYVIRYDIGEIKLLTKFLPSPSEPLAIEYRFSKTSSEAETIPGIGSRGPYRTKQANLIPESERIEVDGKLFVRALDYSIKYESGEIIFGTVVGPTSQIKTSYRYNMLVLPPVSPSKFPKEIKLGSTFLKESAKKGGNSPTTSAIETYSGQDLLKTNFLLNLKNRPVVPTSEASFVVRLKQGGISRTLTREVDYTFPTTEVDSSTGFIKVTPDVHLGYITQRIDPTDGFGTGTIYFYNQSITASDEIGVTYTYRKGIVGNYSGVGDGSKGPYYLRNVRQIVPGTEALQVWTQGSSVITTFTRNSSFDANAGDTGYSINYDQNNPSITFNKELPPAKNFQLIFQYVPPFTSTSDQISQVAYGFDGSFKIGDVFKFDSSFAKSETDQVFVAESTIEGFVGNGTKTYILHSPADIVDGSEKIFINQRLLNRDIDYFVTYTKPGQFNLYYVTPTTLDAISVNYNYQSLTGIVVGGKVKSDAAFKLGAETKLLNNALTINGNTKKIGFDFSPLGGTPIGVGSEYEEYNLNYKPDYNAFYANYAYKFNKNPIGTTRKAFLRSYDHSVSTGGNPKGMAKLDLTYRSFTSLDDLLSGSTLHNNDNQQDSFSLGAIPSEWKAGPLSLSQKYELRKTVSKNDVLDRGASLSTASINYFHLGEDLKFTDRVSIGYDYQLNEPVTLGSLETETAHTKAIDSAYNLSLDLTTLFLQKWTARFSMLEHKDHNLLSTPETSSSTINETYHMDLVPFSILTGSLDHNRQEKTSFVTSGQNPLSLRTTGNLRLTPISWLSLGFNGSKNETIPETGSANKTSGRAFNYDADYSPLSFSAIKLTSRFALSNNSQTAPLGAETVKTDTDTFSQNYTLTLTPLPIFPLTVGVVQENYKNKNNSLVSPVTTETENQTLTANLNLSIPLIPQLSASADYNRKITKNLRTDASRPKTITSGKASYQVTSWGTVNYDISEERNEGEVQAGSIVDLNIRKTIQTLSLNITVPINNPALQNFVLLASLKQVAYTNFANSLDDFKASLLSFEGTINF